MNDKSKQHVDSCRFCWMCRHICPIGNATGLERNNARARALGLSLVNRGTYDLKDVIDNVYECACCGACTKECATGWDPVMFIKDARRDAALSDKLPEYINTLLDNILACGNAYGIKDIDSALKNEIAKHSGKTEVLLFLGVDARFKAPDCAIKAIRAMEKTGVKFTVLENELPSGQQLDFLVGALDETKQQMSSCAKSLEGFETIVAYDPQDALMFKRTYKEMGVSVKNPLTFTEFLADNIEKLNVKKTDKRAVFQDPFQLARDLGETEEARMVASAYLNLDEMLLNRRDTMWAGNILMAEWMPEVMLKVAEDRLFNAKGVKANCIVTASVSEYASLKAVKQSEIEIISLEELILQ